MNKMLKISFDKRVELIFGLYYSVCKELNDNNPMFHSNYKPYCDAFYELYLNHCTPNLKEYIKKGGFDTYNRTVEIALSLDENFNIINNAFIEEINTNNENFDANQLSNLLKEFVNNAHFDAFFNNQKNYYEEAIKKFKYFLNFYSDFNEEMLTKFYGYQLSDSTVILYNFSFGGYGINCDDGLVCLIPMMPSKNEQEIKYSDATIMTLIHEFSHPYCNPLGEKYFQNINMDSFYNEARMYGLENCYTDAITLINEYVVRSISIYLLLPFIKEEYIEKRIKHLQEIGYYHIKEFIHLLANRKNYQTFEEFYMVEIVPFFLNLNDQLTKIK